MKTLDQLKSEIESEVYSQLDGLTVNKIEDKDLDFAIEYQEGEIVFNRFNGVVDVFAEDCKVNDALISFCANCFYKEIERAKDNAEYFDKQAKDIAHDEWLMLCGY